MYARRKVLDGLVSYFVGGPARQSMSPISVPKTRATAAMVAKVGLIWPASILATYCCVRPADSARAACVSFSLLTCFPEPFAEAGLAGRAWSRLLVMVV